MIKPTSPARCTSSKKRGFVKLQEESSFTDTSHYSKAHTPKCYLKEHTLKNKQNRIFQSLQCQNESYLRGGGPPQTSSSADHPWAHLVKPRPVHFEDFTDDQVDCLLSLDIYKHVPGDGYLRDEFTFTLFPHFSSCDSTSRKIPFVELQTLKAATDFRRHSQSVIKDILRGVYPPESITKEKTPNGEKSSLLAPPTIDSRRPVLYQVVYVSDEEELLVLETKDFFVMLPDRLDLHCVLLGEQSVNVQSNKRGFDRRLVSVKDYVWVWSVEPTRAAREDPRRILRDSRYPRLTAFDETSTYYFRVAQYAFVRSACESVYGIVLDVDGEWNPVLAVWDPIRSFTAAFEGAPEAFTLNQSVCGFPVGDIDYEDILLAETKRNVSCAVRFSEPAASPGAKRLLCRLVKDFLPLHSDGGIMPTTVNKLSPEDNEWFSDRLENFKNYNLDPVKARQKMSKVFNMACSAIGAYKSLTIDKRVHFVNARVPNISDPLLRLEVTLPMMTSNSGWSPGKPVALLVKGAKALSYVTVEKVFFDYENEKVDVTLLTRPCSHSHLVRLVKEATYETGQERTVNVFLKLLKPFQKTDPLYGIIVQMRLFDNIHAGTLGNTILDLVYGRKSTSHMVGKRLVSKEELRSLALTARGKKISLVRGQQKAVSLGCAGYPIVAIHGSSGSGKTLIATVIAALCKNERVIITGITNEVVAQIVDTFCSIEEFKDLTVLRYVPFGTTWKERRSTPVDLDEVLKTLGEKFSEHIQSPTDREICRSFAGRISANLSKHERNKPELASPLLEDMVRIMFTVRFPDIICITTSSLLNIFGHGGIFAKYRNAFSMVISDEAELISEPMFIAITNQFPHARQVHIGDWLQFSPHSGWCNLPELELLGARGLLDLFTDVPPMPQYGMSTSFTAHPALNELPKLVTYDKYVISGAKPEDRRLALDNITFPDPTIPFLFVDVVGGISDRGYNVKEATVCREILKRLLAKGLNSSDIAILNFFREQHCRLIRFAQEYGVVNVTVESFRNQHCEIAILLTTIVMPPAEELYLGVLEEEERLLAALTRARHGLIILGNKDFLKCGEYWSKIITWAEGFGGVVQSSELHKFFGGPAMVLESSASSSIEQ